MKLSTSAVKKTANLARLASEPSNEFLDNFTAELGSILQYADEILSVAQPKNAQIGRSVSIASLRNDVPEESEFHQKKRAKIIQLFPKSQGDLLILPGIFHDS